MAGFGRFSFVGEYSGQQVVNVFHFRSADWLPGGGNPFTDVFNFVSAVNTAWHAAYLGQMNTLYKLNTIEGVGYDDAYNIVTPSPLVLTVNEFGSYFTGDTMGAASAAIIGWRCGTQHSINGTGHSLRNRGYSAIGPLTETHVGDDSHIDGALFDHLEAFASAAMTPITLLVPAVTLQPIVIHEKWETVLGHKVLLWRTYSDVLGFAVRRVASFRRSRVPEA